MTGKQLELEDYVKKAHFSGPAYDPALDKRRLTGQILRVFDLMKDAQWRGLRNISEITGDPEASVSAQLRHLRKAKFGSHIVNRRREGEPTDGYHVYQLVLNE